MNKVNFIKGAVAASTLAPYLAMAQLTSGSAGNFGTFISGIISIINEYLIPLAIAVAVLVFIYGIFQYFILGGADEDKRKAGSQLMLYAIIGFVAIVALWAIVAFVAAAFGFEAGAGPLPFSIGPTAG